MILWPNGRTTPPNFSVEGHFGLRNSTAPGASKYHLGLDMWGLGTVRSIADGTVVAVGWGPYGWGGGYQVWIQHDGFFTRSLHMVDGSSNLRVGDTVRAGQEIGREGATGALQVHLHLEVTPGRWHAGNHGQVDPKAWLYARVNSTGNAAAGGGSDEFTEAEMDEIKKMFAELRAEVAEVRSDLAFLKNRDDGTTSSKYGGPTPTHREVAERIVSMDKRQGRDEGRESIGVSLDRISKTLDENLALSKSTRRALGRDEDRVKAGDTIGVSLDRISKTVNVTDAEG